MSEVSKYLDEVEGNGSDKGEEKGANKAPPSRAPDRAKRSEVSEFVDSQPAQDKGFGGHAKDLGLSALKGAVALPQAAVGLAGIPTGGRVGKILENEGGAVGFRPKETKETIDTWRTEKRQDQAQEFQEAEGVVDKADVALSNPSMIADTVVESIPSMIGGGGIARGIRKVAPRVSPVVAGASGEGAIMAGQQAEDIRAQTDDGLLNRKQQAASVATGVAGAVFGWGGGRLAQKMGIGDADTMLAQGVAPSAVAGEIARAPAKSVPRQVIEGALTEGLLEELPQSVSETILQNLSLDKPWSQGVDDAIVMGTLAGMAMGGPASGYNAVVNKRNGNNEDPQNAETEQTPTPLLDEAEGQNETEGQSVPPQQSQAPIDSQDPAPDAQDGTAPDPVPEQYRSESAGARAPLPSEQMGLNPGDGPMSGAAAMAVDTGASEQAIQEKAVEAGEDGEPVEPNLVDGESIDPRTGELTQQTPELAAINSRRSELERGLEVVRRQARQQGWNGRLINQRKRVEQELEQIAVKQEQSKLEDLTSPQENVQSPQERALPKSNTDGAKESGNRKPDNYSDQGEGWTLAERQLNGRDKSEQMQNVTRRTADLILEDLQGSNPEIEAKKVSNRAGGFDVIQRPAEFREVDFQAQAASIDEAANQAATSATNPIPEPTEAQKEAGNYAMGHTRINGLDITIENPRDSTRKGARPDGSEWSHQMTDHYGYIKTTKGADGDHVDVYVGPDTSNEQVFVVDQLDQDSGRFDEHKVMMGYPSQDAAVEAYKSNFDEGWKVGPVSQMSTDELKGWLEDGDTTTEASKATQKEESPETDINAVVAKQMPQMSDDDLQVAIDHYGPDHKRTKKLKREQGKRQGGKQGAEQEKPSSSGLKTLPYGGKRWNNETGQAEDMEGEAEVVDYGGRFVVLKEVNGVMVPFYQSTGAGGKKETKAGNWYPFTGIGKDGWLNKLDGKELASYYGSPSLKRAAEGLDAELGNLSGRSDIPKTGTSGKGAEFVKAINSAFPGQKAASNDESNSRPDVEESLSALKSAVDAEQSPQETAGTSEAEVAKRWNAMTPKQRAEMLAQPGSPMATKSGKPSVKTGLESSYPWSKQDDKTKDAARNLLSAESGQLQDVEASAPKPDVKTTPAPQSKPDQETESIELTRDEGKRSRRLASQKRKAQERGDGEAVDSIEVQQEDLAAKISKRQSESKPDQEAEAPKAEPTIGKRAKDGYLRVNGKFITPHQDYGYVVRGDAGGVFKPDRSMYGFETEQAAAEFAAGLPRDFLGGVYDPEGAATKSNQDAAKVNQLDRLKAGMNALADRADKAGDLELATNLRTQYSTAKPVDSDIVFSDLNATRVDDILRTREPMVVKAERKAVAAKEKSSAPPKAPEPEIEANKSDNRFAGNKLFTSDAVEAARARIKSKMGTLNSGFDPEMAVDGMTIAGAYIESGVRKFSDYAALMTEDFGSKIKPHLLSFWEGARHSPGLDTEGMTSAEDSANEFKDLVAEGAESASEAIGETVKKPKKRTKKTGQARDRVLTDDWGVDSIDGYGDEFRETGNDTKDAFLKEASLYARSVSDVLAENGFEVAEKRKGKGVNVNQSGMAGSGDVSLEMTDPVTGTGIYMTIGESSLKGVVPATQSGIAVMYRASPGSAMSSGNNKWAPTDLSAADLAAMIELEAQNASKRTNGGQSDRQNRPEVEGSDSERAQGSDGASERGGTSTQSGSSQADSVSVAPGKPGNVEEADGSGTDQQASDGSTGTNVDGNGQPDEAGVSSDGRKGAGRKKQSSDGAGKRDSGKNERGSREPVAPAPKSPSAPGPTNFHYDDPLEIVGGGQVARFKKNQAAIERYNDIRDTGRPITEEDQRVLAAYTGWGSFGQELFQGTWGNARPKDGWQARDQWLRDQMGQDEWEGMQQSIINAHYTDPPTVTAMWDMVKNMGFKGGRVLEPSMGIGNFFGMMPEALKSRSNLAGIELDPVTGGMAKMLYPDANVSVMGYEKSKTPDNFYDVVIGNWPFANIPVPDRKYQKLNPNLHDYFFLKALDQTRPGGLVVGITSHGSMDKKGKVIRNELARKGELVAAYRLPTGAFQEYAGTKVVTDIVILRKRAEPLGMVPSDTGWLESVPFKTPSGDVVFVNEYFVNNPDNVIGTIDFGHGTTSGRPGLVVNRPDNVAERLNEIAKNVPEGAYLKDDGATQISYVTNHLDDREGSLVRDKSGVMGVVRGEYIANASDIQKYAVKSEKVTQKREAELDSLISMRRAYGELIESEQADSDGDSKAKRANLKKQYDAFVKANGPLNESFGLKYMRRVGDPFYPALAALEREKEGGYEPSDILTQSTMRERKKIDSPSVSEAYVVARNHHINPTLEQISELAKKPEKAVRKELIDKGAIFDLPNGDIEAADIYLSGNVRQKLREAKASLESGNKLMQRNVEALELVKPADIPNFNIEAQMGATWVAREYYEQFVGEMLGMSDTKGIEATYRAGRWKIKMPSDYNHRPEAKTGSGTEKYAFNKLVNAAISNQTVTIKTKDNDGKEYVNKTATEEANGKIAEMRTKFSEWVWSEPERRDDLEREYNEVRNSFATPTFDGSFMTMEGMALSLGDGPFDLRKHQQDAIWRALVTRKSLNAHEVGTGKTFTMAGIAIESRRYGLAKKPLVLAHNANSKTVANEIQQMYPAAKILYIDNLKAGEIAIRMRQIANDDWDAIVMPHSLINGIGFREETLMQMAQQDIDELMDEAYEAAKEDGVEITEAMFGDDEDSEKALGLLRSPTAKELVKSRKKIVANITKQAQKSSKEDSIPFEELGIDMVLVDEVHEFKKPPIATKMRIKGMNTQSSDRSIALRFMLKYVRGMNKGGNVHTFSGTPITNSMTEAFHQMRYIMEEEMRDAGLDQWDGWFGSFAQEEMDIELTAAGEYESVTRLSKFINTPELRRMIGQYMDVVFSDDMPEMQPRKTDSGKTLTDPTLTDMERAQLLNGRTEGAKDRPYKQVLNTNSDLTPDQKRHFETIQGYAKSFRDMSGKQRVKTMRRGDPESPIVYEGLAAKVSFDSRLMNGEELAGMEGQIPDDPASKASKVIDNVMEIYQSDERATQVVFAQLGLGKSATKKTTDAAGNKHKRTYKVFSTAHDMVERLVAKGIPREQIAMVTGGTGKDKRAAIAEAMNSSEIRLVIGSTQSLGVGVNMQKNLRAIHHMDAPWMPGDLEQRNGRGQRQGNQWNTVREYRYLTDRIDGRRWQLLVKKQQFIQKFMKSDDSVRIIEADGATDDDNDMLESFAEAAGDARILQLAKVDKKINMAQRRERQYSQGIANAKRQMRSLHNSIEADTNHVARHEAVRAEHRVAAALSENAGNSFSMTLDGKTYHERGKAQDALSEFISKNIRMGTKQREFATYGDLALTIGMSQNAAEPQLYIKFADGLEDLSNKPTVAAFEARLRGFSNRLDRSRQSATEGTESLARAKKVSREPFQQADELVRLQKQLMDIKQDLENNPVAPPSWLRTGAAAETEVLWNGETFTVTGHRWNDAGWFVLAEDGSGTAAIPYMEVMDKQGFTLYEEREFVPPKVVEKKDEEKEGGSEASFRRTPDIKQGQMSAQEVRSATNGMMRGWNNRPGVTVADSISELPKGLREAIRKAGAESDMRAVIWKDGIYILAPRIPDRAALEEVVLHEAIGHYGLRKMMGKELVPLLTEVYGSLGNSEQANELKKTYFEGKFNDRNLNHRLTIAEELIAHLAETGKHQNRSLFKRILAAVRNGLRRLGFTLEINERDLLALLDGAHRTVENGGVSLPSSADLHFRRAYHGTAHRFDEFSLEAIGNGEGVQAFGWGLYFAGHKKVAEYYRDLDGEGNLYQVDVPDDAELLYRNAPLSEQTEAVKEKLNTLIKERNLNFGTMTNEDIESAIMLVDADADTDGLSRSVLIELAENVGAMEYLGKMNDDPTGNYIYKELSDRLGSDQAASRALSEAGIPGLRYLDATSRYLGVKEENHNYVIWDDKRVSVESVNDELNQAEAYFSRTGQSNTDDVRFSLAGPTPSSINRGVASAAVGKKISRQLKGKLADIKPSALGALPLMYLRDFAPKSMTALDRYMDERRSMDADRNEMHSRYDEVSQRWLKIRIGNGSYADKALTASGLRPKKASGLDSLMHDATIMAIDPSKERKSDVDKAQYAMLKKQFDALDTDEQNLFTDVRNAYSDQITAMEETIQANVEKSVAFSTRRAQREMEAEIKQARDEMTGAEQDQAIEKAEKRYYGRAKAASEGKTSRTLALRKKFEQLRVDEPYFPLKRFGDYFVSLRDSEGDLKSFSMFESAADMEAAAEQLRKKYPNLEATVGRKSNKEEMRDAIDPTFIADIQELIGDEIGDESLNDAIYQMYLETLPDFSMRKSFIHRNKVDGYNQDAMRAFASSMFHSSHQIARLKHKLEMDELVEITEEQAQDAEDSVDAMAVANEMRLRHEWVMNPQGGKVAQRITSAAFIYQLGVTPAAAIVNTSQTFMMGIPILGSRFKNEAGAGSELLKASKDFIVGKGRLANNLKGEEKEALNEFIRMGLIDKTQAHNLAGVGDTGVEYSAVREKVMGGISFLFHHAERYNREVTSIAAYRMARKSGMDHKAAVKEAADLTWTVHFDYSSGNRARYMQNDTAKVLLVFRQHSINMLSRLVIDARAMFKGESKEVKQEARRRLAGIYGMFAVMAGMMGVPGAQAILMLLEALDWDDEDPWTMEDKIKQAVFEALGEDGARIFFNGVPGTALDLNLTNRIGLGHLWFFSPYRELEGRDSYVYWMEQLLGAAPAMIANTVSGLSIMGEGQIARGFETMLPKAGKDLMRSVRYSNEGVQSLNGKSVVDEVESWGVISQALGFTPAHITEQYDKNSSIKGAEQRIKRERRSILNRYALAVRTGDDEMRDQLSGKINSFNRRYPRIRITGQTILRSMQGRARSRAKAEGGLVIDNRLNYLRDGVDPSS